MNTHDVIEKLLGIILLSCFINNALAGDDVIFFAGFDRTGAEINCPDALPLNEMTNEFNNPYFTGSGSIDAMTLKEYFSVDMNEHEWFKFQANIESGIYSGKPLISIFNSEGNSLLAQNADPQPLFSSVIYRSEGLNRYCIQIENDSLYSSNDSNGNNSGNDYFDFSISATPLVFEDYDDFNMDAEPNDSIVDAQSGLSLVNETFSDFTHLVGSFNSGSDVDVYRLSTSNVTKNLSIIDFPAGISGHGGTTEFRELKVMTADGLDILARINPALGSNTILMPVQAGTDYLIQLGSANLILGNNPTYVVKLETLDYASQQEENNTANNQASDAEFAVDVFGSISPSPGYKLYSFSGMLSGNTDVDWWRFEVFPYETINLFCNSAHYGSGVIEALFEVYSDPLMPVLQIEVENPNTGLSWSENTDSTMPPVVVESNQIHYLRVAANQFSDEVLNRFYTCNIQVFE